MIHQSRKPIRQNRVGCSPVRRQRLFEEDLIEVRNWRKYSKMENEEKSSKKSTQTDEQGNKLRKDGKRFEPRGSSVAAQRQATSGIAAIFNNPGKFDRFMGNIRKQVSRIARTNAEYDEIINSLEDCQNYKDLMCVDRHMGGRIGDILNDPVSTGAMLRGTPAKGKKRDKEETDKTYREPDLAGYEKCREVQVKACTDNMLKSLKARKKISKLRPKSCKDKCKKEYKSQPDLMKVCNRRCTTKAIGKSAAFGAGAALAGAGIYYGTKFGASGIKSRLEKAASRMAGRFTQK